MIAGPAGPILRTPAAAPARRGSFPMQARLPGSGLLLANRLRRGAPEFLRASRLAGRAIPC